MIVVHAAVLQLLWRLALSKFSWSPSTAQLSGNPATVSHQYLRCCQGHFDRASSGSSWNRSSLFYQNSVQYVLWLDVWLFLRPACIWTQWHTHTHTHKTATHKFTHTTTLKFVDKIDVLRFPAYTPLLCRAAEAWYDSPMVTAPLLKFVLEFVTNNTG